MRKLTTLLLVICMLCSLTACSNSQQTGTGTNTAEASKETATKNTMVENTTVENTTDAAADTSKETGQKTLVVYFSATGNTKSIAEKIAGGLSADIYEIVPETPYTDADLNYNDNNSRSTQEMNDSSSRPAMNGNVEDLSQYSIVYIGYPIWWGEAPRILDTFVESNDFTDINVIPFCTSASSGIGSSAKTLEEIAGTGNWVDGQRFSGSESDAEVMEWVN